MGAGRPFASQGQHLRTEGGQHPGASRHRWLGSVKGIQGHCCIKAKGVLTVPQSGDAGPSDTLENRNKPGI
jgi:hypothetical protein